MVQARRNFQLLQVPQFIDAIACLATEIAEEEWQLDPQLHDSFGLVTHHLAEGAAGSSVICAQGFRTLRLQPCLDQKAKVTNQ